MASPNTPNEEDIHYLDTLPGIWVRTSLYMALALLMSCRTCVVTLIRVVEFHKGSLHVITDNYAVIGISTILEPLLGIITCSLPFLRPVLSRLRELLGLSPLTGLGSERSHQRGRYEHQPVYGDSIGSRPHRAHIRDPYPLDTIRLSHYDSMPGMKLPKASETDSVSFEHNLQHGDLSGKGLDEGGWI
jgi:hypothetical protein